MNFRSLPREVTCHEGPLSLRTGGGRSWQVLLYYTINVSPILCTFIQGFLTHREQRVRINDIVSTVGLLSISTDASRCYVLSAILFIIYTHELKSRFRNCHKINYADGTVICRFDF